MKYKYRIFSLIIGISILTYGVYYIVDQPQIIYNLRCISTIDMIIIIILWFLIYLLTGLKFKFIYNKYNENLHFSEWYGMTMIGSMTNYLLPQSGIAIRASYFKYKKDLPFNNFLQIQILDYLYFFITCSSFGIVINFFIQLDAHIRNSLFIFFILVALICTLIFVKLDNLKIKKSILMKLVEFVKSVQKFNTTDNAKKMIFLNIVKIILISTLYYFTFYIIDAKIDYLLAMTIGIVINILIFFPITPGNIGIQEVLVAVLSETTAVGYEKGLLVALIIRSTNIIFVFINGIIYSKYFIIKKNL